MTAGRVIAPERARALLRQWRDERAAVAIALGSFDVVSAAHARALASARRAAGRLLVLVRDDASSGDRLGAGRPVLAAAERARLVAALRGVDAVVVAGEAGAGELEREAGVTALELDSGPGGPDAGGAMDVVARIRARQGRP